MIDCCKDFEIDDDIVCVLVITIIQALSAWQKERVGERERRPFGRENLYFGRGSRTILLKGSRAIVQSC